MPRLLITGSSGLIGSEAVSHFDLLGWDIYGVDINARRDLFGSEGDTSWNLRRLVETTRRFHPYNTDIRNRNAILALA